MDFLQLAHKYRSNKHNVMGWFASEKLDGMRCYWDGGVSRGEIKSNVPWANLDKDARYVDEQRCTGLWSRYGNIIHAPDDWIDGLPSFPLDGEIYWLDQEGGSRQELMKIVKPLDPSSEDWAQLCLYAFDAPAYENVFQDRRIKGVNFTKYIDKDACLDWISDRLEAADISWLPQPSSYFSSIYKGMLLRLGEGSAHVLVQEEITSNAMLDDLLAEITDVGGEGLIVRNPYAIWQPQRTHDVLKIKKLDDAEGVVVGCTSGRETEKGSKLLGMMGALIIQLGNGRILELSGFTEEERELDGEEAVQYAMDHPGLTMPEWVMPKMFNKGDTVTFRYRGVTNDGIPQEARYWRTRDEC